MAFLFWTGYRCTCMKFSGPSMTQKILVEVRAIFFRGLLQIPWYAVCGQVRAMNKLLSLSLSLVMMCVVCQAVCDVVGAPPPCDLHMRCPSRAIHRETQPVSPPHARCCELRPLVVVRDT